MVQITKYITKLIGKENKYYDEYIGSSRFKDYILALNYFKKISKRFNYYFNKEKFLNFLIFAIWLKIIDDKLDLDYSKGEKYLTYLKMGKIKLTNIENEITFALYQITKNNKTFLNSLEKLYYSNETEKTVKSMREYIKIRYNNGKLIAICSMKAYDKKALNNSKYVKFFQTTMAICNLIDSVLDLKEDLKNKQYNFTVTFIQKIGLIMHTSIKSLSYFLKYPFMISILLNLSWIVFKRNQKR